MAHIQLNNDFPGIVGLLYHKPRIGRAANALANTALRGSSPLTPAERELIAAHVSSLNNCDYCRNGHAAVASELLQDEGSTASCVINGSMDSEQLSPKMKVLLQIASKVQQSGRAVSSADIERARAAGATDDDIHDTVLVAALFCFFNRYVDGLGTFTPDDENFYREGGEFLAKNGYPKPNPIGRFFVNRMYEKYRQVGVIG